MTAPGERRGQAPDGFVPRAARTRVRELPLAAVLAVLGAGLLTVKLHHFRIGGLLIGLSLLLAAALRLWLAPRSAGLLVVRNRVLDVLVLAVLGVAILILTRVVPTGAA